MKYKSLLLIALVASLGGAHAATDRSLSWDGVTTWPNSAYQDRQMTCLQKTIVAHHKNVEEAQVCLAKLASLLKAPAKRSFAEMNRVSKLGDYWHTHCTRSGYDHLCSMIVGKDNEATTHNLFTSMTHEHFMNTEFMNMVLDTLPVDLTRTHIHTAYVNRSAMALYAQEYCGMLARAATCEGIDNALLDKIVALLCQTMRDTYSDSHHHDAYRSYEWTDYYPGSTCATQRKSTRYPVLKALRAIGRAHTNKKAIVFRSVKAAGQEAINAIARELGQHLSGKLNFFA